MFLISRHVAEPGLTRFSDKPHSFRSPASEHAYDFRIEVFYRRSSAARRRTSVWLDERERTLTRGIVRETARKVSREFSILEPGRAEYAINEELARRFTAAEHVDQSTWCARVEVISPEEVREMMRKRLQERYQIESRACADEERLKMTEVLRRRWTDFLDEAAKNPIAPYALKLAENPQEIAQVLKAMLGERREDTSEWLNLVTRIVEAHRSADVLDLVVESDSVLRRTLEMMGIELPPQSSDAFYMPEKSDH